MVIDEVATPWCGLASALAQWGQIVSGGPLGQRWLRGLAALQENIPADTGEEEKRGDLAGLGHSGRIGTAWNAYLTRQQGWADDLAAEPRLHGLTGDD